TLDGDPENGATATPMPCAFHRLPSLSKSTSPSDINTSLVHSSHGMSVEARLGVNALPHDDPWLVLSRIVDPPETAMMRFASSGSQTMLSVSATPLIRRERRWRSVCSSSWRV